MLAIRIQEEVEIEVIRLQVGNTSAQGLALPPALPGFQAQHFSARRGGRGASAIGGPIIHHQDAVETEGLQPLQHQPKVIRFVMGGDDRGDPHRRHPRCMVAEGQGWP